MNKTTIAAPKQNQNIKNNLLQPAREENISALVAYFESGITPEPGKIGIELEHIIVNNDGLKPVSYSEDHGVLWLLEQLRSEYDETILDAEGDLLGLMREGESITLEPAGQLEISAGPFSELGEASIRFAKFEEQLARLLAPVGKRALLTGYHPTAQATDLELIPKRRYKFMDFYLRDIGTYGPCMMRGSAATQVSIDYSSIDDCLRKLRLAFALVPIVSLLCDNSAVFEGQPRTHQLVRTEIWEKCDPDRCGLVPGVMEPDFNLRRYAEYILDTPAILVPCNNREWCYSEKTFGELYADTPMDRVAVEHALSMFFNDVRLKTYIEIRPADSMPIAYVIAYAAFIKGLFYSEENLDELDTLFANVRAEDVDDAKRALMEKGFDASVYGRPVSELADSLISLARSGLSAYERPCLVSLEDLIRRRKTLADMTKHSS